MRSLHGGEIAGFIKERQAKEVRRLKQSLGISPQLVILRTHQTPVNDLYLRIKQRYGEEIGVTVTTITKPLSEINEVIQSCNLDNTVHGLLVQLPLEDPSRTDEIVSLIAPQKDVDGLQATSSYTASTAVAIEWLLAGYGVELVGKNLLVVGYGRLVGEPLVKLWKQNGLDPVVVDRPDLQLEEKVRAAQVIVSATGQPDLIHADWLTAKSVIVDAGTATDSDGEVRGDVELAARERDDISITPVKGGVGPLTVAALFDNVLEACRIAAAKQ